MNHRNTLNTRLLPLSILISSLIASGTTSATLPTFNNVKLPIVTQVTVDTKSPVDRLLELLIPARTPITPELIKNARLHVNELKANNELTIKDYEDQTLNLVTPDDRIRATEVLTKFKESSDRTIAQLETGIAFAEDPSDENRSEYTKAVKDIFVYAINSNTHGEFTPAEIESLFNAHLAKNLKDLPSELRLKIESIRKLEDYLTQGVITQEQRVKLGINSADKQIKLNTQAEAKRAQKAAEEAKDKATADELSQADKTDFAEKQIIIAGNAKTSAVANVTALNQEKAAAITAVNATWSDITVDLEKKLQDLIDNTTTTLEDKTKAETAQKAIVAAIEANRLAVDAATQYSTTQSTAIAEKAKYDAAKLATAAATAELDIKTNNFNDAVSTVVALGRVTDPTIDLPAFEQVIKNTETQAVIADTVAFGTQVTGGTQTVADKGKIIGSTITDDGKIDLAAGADASITKIVEGTMTNHGGEDWNTWVGAKGLLVLAGTDKDNLAQSIRPKVFEGGKITVGEFSQTKNLESNKGEVVLQRGSFTKHANINGGSLVFEAGAEANGIRLQDINLDLVEGATADNTTLYGNSTFTIKRNAKTTGTRLTGNDNQMIVEDGAEASDTDTSKSKIIVKSGGLVKNTKLTGSNGQELLLESGAKALNTTLKNSTLILGNGAKADGTKLKASSTFTLLDGAETKDTDLHSGKFTVNANATANNTTVNGGQFDLAGTANDTILNSGEFTITDGATANNTTVKGGKFNVMARARAMKLELENGITMIAGQLEDATLNGGSAIFDKTAEISGTINSNTNNVLSMYEGAKTADVDLNLGGNLQLIGANAPQSAFHRAAMTNPAQFAFKNVTLNGGTIDMSSTNTQLTMASLAGNGNFTLASSLYNQANAPLNVLGDANGTFDIQIKDNGVAPTNLKLIDVQGANNARFTLSNGAVNLGNYLHTLVSDGQGGFKLVADLTKLTPSTAGVLAVANTLPVIFNAELSSIQNRLDKQSTSANKSGVWVNYLNDNFKVSGTAANFDQKLSGMTFGGDKAIEIGDSVLSIGGFGSYSNSDIKSDYQSSGSVKSNSLGAYAQYLTNNGYYLNGVLKANQFKQKLNIASQSHSANGNANVSGLGIAVKAGKHINLDAAYISPYVALSTFTSGKNSSELSNGMKVENKGSSNTTGTLGMNAGYRFVLNNGAEIKPYALLSVDQDLKASNDVMINSEMFDNSRKGTRVNAGLGANVNVTKNLSVGSEVKVSKGKNVDTPVTINLGVAYTF